jgi:rhodanese-related sulfurtransferase
MSKRKTVVMLVCWLFAVPALPLQADELEVGEGGDFIPLTADKKFLHVLHEGKSVKVQRVQDPDFQLTGYFAKTGRKCPPFCIHPLAIASGVETVGEVEIFDFMETLLRDGKGLLIDARTPKWHKRGTIPGSVNYPFTVLSQGPDEPEMVKALEAFGAQRRATVGTVDRWLEKQGFLDGDLKSDKWDFTQAKELVLWCNGPACDQSPRAVKGLLEVGYPAGKLKYYRGGMQMWQLWGLTTVVPEG